MPKRLREISLLETFADDQIKELEAVIQQESFSKGEVVFSEGSVGDALYIISSGEVSICQTTDDQEKRLKTIAVIEEGDFFGEMSLFKEEEVRSASVVAQSDTTLFRLSKENFLRLLESGGVLAKSLLSVIVSRLSERLRQMNHHFITVYETGKATGSGQTIEEVARTILKRLLSTLPIAEGGLFLLWNRFNEEYDLLSCIGYDQKKAIGMRIDAHEPLLRWLAHKREIVRINNLDQEKELVEYKKTCPYLGQSLLAGPMLDEKGNVIGFIILNSCRKMAFKREDQILLETVIDQIVPAIKISIYNKEHEYRRDLEERKFWDQRQFK
ncbi:TPA: hypothetical protein DCX15_01840 [bacterium]|nr:hypothetical protein [bacterium]